MKTETILNEREWLNEVEPFFIKELEKHRLLGKIEEIMKNYSNYLATRSSLRGEESDKSEIHKKSLELIDEYLKETPKSEILAKLDKIKDYRLQPNGITCGEFIRGEEKADIIDKIINHWKDKGSKDIDREKDFRELLQSFFLSKEGEDKPLSDDPTDEDIAFAQMNDQERESYLKTLPDIKINDDNLPF